MVKKYFKNLPVIRFRRENILTFFIKKVTIIENTIEYKILTHTILKDSHSQHF